MFGFLNSTALFAAAAALIPLIIHLFSKRRVKIVEFSSVRHLKAMQKRQVRRLKIRQWLLLILRMLIILAVVLAFARPTTKSGSVGAHASVTAVVLFDNSASMGRYVTDGFLFDIAKRRAEELLATIGQADQIMLIPLCDDASAAPAFGSAASAREKLAAVRLSGRRADYDGALESASNQIKVAANLNREIYLISDRQRSSLPSSELLTGVEAKVYLVDLPMATGENCGVTALDLGGQLIMPGVEFGLAATVKNYGGQDRNDILASLYLDGRRVQQAQVEVGAGAENRVRFAQTVASTGFHSGYVELSDDNFPADNRYYFSFSIPEKFALLLIGGDAAARFIELAMVPNAAMVQAWSVKRATPEQLGGVDLGEYDVISLAGAPKLDDRLTSRIKTQIRQGKALFVTYGSQTDIASFNQTWSEVTGVAFDQPLKQTFSRSGYYSIEAASLEHPIFTVFGLEKSKLPEIKFFTLPTSHLVGHPRSLMKFTGGMSALVENKYGAGKVITFTGPIAPEYTDLPGHAFFVPFVSRIAEYLASNLSSLDIRLFVGAPITRGVNSAGAITSSIQMTAPDSMAYALTPQEKDGALTVQPSPVEQAGIYSLSYDGREIDRFAANLDPNEADLAQVDVDQFGSAIGAAEYHELTPSQPLATAIAGFRFGRELWQIFVWIAVFLLAAEMLLARGAVPEE